jgi:hypothetical protein
MEFHVLIGGFMTNKEEDLNLDFFSGTVSSNFILMGVSKNK